MSKERLKYVDVLRVLAMIPVVVCHFTRALEAYGISFPIKILPDIVFGTYLGDFGVTIFFILSGVSLMYNYDGRLDIKQYFKKRFLGIYPMFWAAWFIGCLYYFYQRGHFNPAGVPKKSIILTVVGMDGYLSWYGPNFYILGEWFLGCLILLYILFPLLKLGIDKKPVVTAIIIAVIYFVGPHFYHMAIPDSIFVLFRIPEFAFGMYFVKYIKKTKLPVGLASGVILGLLWFLDTSKLSTLNKNTIIGISVFLFVNWICSYIKWDGFYNVCGEIGKLSYAVFLVHHVVIMEITRHFAFTALDWADVILLFILCAVVTAVFAKWLMSIDKALKKVLFKPKKTAGQ